MEMNRIEEVLLMTKQLRNKERKIIKFKGMLKNCGPDQTFLIVIFVTSAGKSIFYFLKTTNFQRLCTYISVFFSSSSWPVSRKCGILGPS